MIISIRGSNGSGKSSVVRKIMQLHTTCIKMSYPPDMHRHRPLGYICQTDWRRLVVLGHYEIANGGLDTIHDLNYAYKLALEHHGLGCNVIMEGMNASDGTLRTLKLHQTEIDIRVVLLNTSLKECITNVRARGHSIQEKDIQGRYNKCLKNVETFEKEGICVLRASATEAVKEIMRWLRE
jgi:nicotinamide riboside kinase